MLLDSLTAIDGCRNYNSWLASHFLSWLRGDVIEIGSGIGSLAQYYDLAAVNSACLTDISASMLGRLESRFASHPKCRIRELDILMPSGLPDDMRSGFDCLICLNVLEHIDDDGQALARMYDLLKPEGRLLLLVPALPFLYGSIDKAAGHYRRYARRGMADLAGSVGFVTENSYYVNFFGIFTWILSSRILRRQNISVAGCRVLDRLVPVLRFMESWLHPPIGQSLVYIGRKPAG
ncbi:MAG: class I SAM-dependent methyltransferase [Candidatus Omnitrophica bacterium]|nr:class I SAM-dependent methyltransferase [Candidatus Omnitrophota bacterium]